MDKQQITGGSKVKYDDETFITLYYYDGMLMSESSIIERKLDKLGFTDNTVEDEDKK